MTEKIREYGKRFLGIALCVFLLHGAKCFSGIVGIDTEDMINMQEMFYNGWLETGRQGLYVIKWLTGTLSYNPFFAGLMTILTLAASLFLYTVLWDRVSGAERSGVWTLLPVLCWCSHPILTEQLYFSLQSVEVSFGIGLTALSVYEVFLWQKDQKRVRLLAAGLLALLTFSSYQAFVPFYIWTVVGVLLLDALSSARGKEPFWLWKKMGAYLAVFLCAFFTNWVLTRLFFSASDYLEKQVLWGEQAFSDNLRAIGMHIIALQTGRGSVYYSAGYTVLAVCFLVLLGLRAGKGAARRGTLFFLAIALLATPYLMTLVCGCAPAVRSQLVLPANLALLWYLCGMLAQEGGAIKYEKPALILLGVFLLWTQAQVTMRLYYTEECRYRQDVARAQEMIREIDKAQGAYPLPVAFVGELAFEGNASCLVGETMGHSFFEHDSRMEPASYYSSGRILGLMKTLGRDYHRVRPEQMEKAWEYSYYMPGWPYENSVARQEDMIVVKLNYWE